MIPDAFTSGSEGGCLWRNTVMLNCRFAAKLFAALFAFACLGQFILLVFAPKTQPGGAILYILPIVIGLLICFEISEVRNLSRHLSSVITRDQDYPAESIWLAAVLEAIAPLVGFSLIGGLVGWQTSLGGPPLVVMAVIPLVSILRLDYRICLLQGVIGAFGYWLIVMMALSQSAPEVLSEGRILQILKGVLLIMSGGLAGLIAQQNRQRLQEIIRVQEQK